MSWVRELEIWVHQEKRELSQSCTLMQCNTRRSIVQTWLYTSEKDLFQSVCESFVKENTASHCKKRTYEDENRILKSACKEDFVFTGRGGKPLCLICHFSLSHYKASYLKRHCEIKTSHMIIDLDQN